MTTVSNTSQRWEKREGQYPRGEEAIWKGGIVNHGIGAAYHDIPGLGISRSGIVPDSKVCATSFP